MKFYPIIVVLSLLASASAHASGFECKDFTGDLVYSTSSSDGGPCCGRSESSLSYKGQVLKSVLNIGEGPGGGGGTTDSNPALKIAEGDHSDLNNGSKQDHFYVSYFAMNLTLSRSDGTPPLPDRSDTVISMLCKDSRYAGPPIP